MLRYGVPTLVPRATTAMLAAEVDQTNATSDGALASTISEITDKRSKAAPRATLVVALWSTSPVLVLALVTLAYGLGAAGLALGLRRRLRDGPKPFAGTIEEFRKDRECFGKRN